MTTILDLLLLKNSAGTPALVLLGPDGVDRLRTPCVRGFSYPGGEIRHVDNPIPYDSGFGVCANCAGRGWLPTPNLGDVLEAARQRWKPHFIFTWVNSFFVLEVRHATWVGHYRVDAANLTVEQAWCDVLKQALEAEGAKP